MGTNSVTCRLDVLSLNSYSVSSGLSSELVCSLSSATQTPQKARALSVVKGFGVRHSLTNWI